MSGIFEILIILAIVLVVFGAAKLPAVGEALGRMVRNFKSASVNRDEIEVSSKVEGERKQHADSGE
jgi:sec-independent protein translocase protein TatA